MTCEECEALLIEAGGEGSAPELGAHLEGCGRCRAFARSTAEALSLSAVPLSEAERERLEGLADATLQAWKGRERRRGLLYRLGGLALAAGIGAVVASAALLSSRPTPSATTGPLWEVSFYEEPSELGPDELAPFALEVAWTGEPTFDLPDFPEPEEGEAP